MPSKFDPSRVVVVYVCVTGGEVEAASSFSPKINPLGFSPTMCKRRSTLLKIDCIPESMMIKQDGCVFKVLRFSTTGAETDLAPLVLKQIVLADSQNVSVVIPAGKVYDISGNLDLAFNSFQLEEYGSAVEDASRAVEIDPDYSKVKKIHPNDPDAAKKLKECEKAVLKLRFEEAIALPDSQRHSITDSIKFCSTGVGPGSSYVPPQAAVVAVAVVLLAILVVLGTKSVTLVVTAAMATLLVVMRTSCCGATQYTSARIEGDVVTLAFVKKMMDDFKNQKSLHKRYAYQIVLQTKEMLQALPSLCYLIENKIGESEEKENAHRLRLTSPKNTNASVFNIQLNGLPSEENRYLFNGDFVDRGSFSGLMCELLWSDPQSNFGRGPSKRGVGVSFGPDVTKRFLHENNLGYKIEHDGKLITVFSAPNYCVQMGNKGAFIRFEAPSLKPKTSLPSRQCRILMSSQWHTPTTSSECQSIWEMYYAYKHLVFLNCLVKALLKVSGRASSEQLSGSSEIFA
ncbi:hypothetical protein LguiB_015890 [Lonicera macranthoides]